MQSPHWFDTFINQQSKEEFITVEAARLSYRSWDGTRNKKQSLLFVHGHGAHSHWWDFIAPAFIEDYNVAAIDLSGNGNSDHRAQYSAVTYAKEILAAASQQQNTIVIGHSFGGMMTRIAAFLNDSDTAESSKIKGIVLVDSIIPTEKGAKAALPSQRKRQEKASRYYQSIEKGMLRFRLKPPQKCEHQFVINHIARHSLKKSEQGYSFKVDQGVFAKMQDNIELPSGVAMIQNITCPIGFIYGNRSRFFPEDKHQFLENLMGKDRVVVIPDAAHHVFLDQPQVFIKALATLLSKLQT